MTHELRWRWRHAVYAAELVLAGTVTVHLTACSVLLPLGAARNNRRYPEGALPTHRVAGVPGHPRIRVITVSGDTIAGRFGGIRLLPEPEYAPRYAAWRAHGHADFPELGQQVRVERLKERPVTGRFAGFGVSSVRVRTGRWDEHDVPLESVKALGSFGGPNVALDTLRALAGRNALPSRTLVQLHFFPDPIPEPATRYAEANRRRARVPFHDIRAVILDSRVASMPAAIASGVALDAAALVTMVAAAYSRGSGCSYDASGISIGFP